METEESSGSYSRILPAEARYSWFPPSFLELPNGSRDQTVQHSSRSWSCSPKDGSRICREILDPFNAVVHGAAIQMKCSNFAMLVVCAFADTETMQSENLVPCAYKRCRCLVEVEDQFCTSACAATKDKPLSKCPCGHPECDGSEEARKQGEEERDNTSRMLRR